MAKQPLKIKHQRVDSSNISSIGYDAASKTLEIKFKTAAIYQYSNVPKIQFTNLAKASSVGSYFSAHIRGKYDYKEI